MHLLPRLPNNTIKKINFNPVHKGDSVIFLGRSLAGWIRDLFSPPRQYGVKSVTREGEEVKSLGEKRIADYLSRNGINYIYEKEAVAKFFIFSSTIGYPDFYLPDYGIYVEYWGLVGADDRRTRESYIRQMRWKMAQYHRHSIKFISIYPDNLNDLDRAFRGKFRKVTGFEPPR